MISDGECTGTQVNICLFYLLLLCGNYFFLSKLHGIYYGVRRYNLYVNEAYSIG